MNTDKKSRVSDGNLDSGKDSRGSGCEKGLSPRRLCDTHQTEVEGLREAYAALNRGDVGGFVKGFDPQIERIEPADFPGGGTYHGLEAVKAHVSKGRGTWAEGSCEPEEFLVAGDKIIVFVHVRVRLKTESQWRDGRLADVYSFRNGKAIGFRTFADRREALEWAGAEASAAV